MRWDGFIVWQQAADTTLHSQQIDHINRGFRHLGACKCCFTHIHCTHKCTSTQRIHYTCAARVHTHIDVQQVKQSLYNDKAERNSTILLDDTHTRREKERKCIEIVVAIVIWWNKNNQRKQLWASASRMSSLCRLLEVSIRLCNCLILEIYGGIEISKIKKNSHKATATIETN